jgi:BASS family bile acid:Na+ symporter
MNQDPILAIALPITLFCIMFGMGTALTLDNFRLLLRQPRPILIGMLSQMLLLPLLAWLLLSLFDLPPELFVGFMILALAPGGTTSNAFTYLAGGNLALSIALTAIVSLLVPLSIPLIAAPLIESRLGIEAAIALPFGPTLGKLVAVGLLPVFLGMWLRHVRPGFCRRHEAVLTRLPLLLLLAVIAGIIASAWHRMPGFLEATAVPALSLATAALFAGYGFARLMREDPRNARTIAIETSIQNGGTAIFVTGSLLQQPAMTVAPVMYGILMLLPVFAWLMLLRLRPAGAWA